MGATDEPPGWCPFGSHLLFVVPSKDSEHPCWFNPENVTFDLSFLPTDERGLIHPPMWRGYWYDPVLIGQNGFFHPSLLMGQFGPIQKVKFTGGLKP